MRFLIAIFAILVVFAASNNARELEDVFADTASTFEFIGGADVDDAFDISEFSDKSNAFDDTISNFEYIGDKDDDDLLDSNEFSVDANKNSSDLVVDTITKDGYPVEVHKVATDDGYILRMHRIPSSPNTQSANGKRQPVLLMHALLDSSATYVLMGPNQSLAYMLADAGYDVWMGNARGNRYSRSHEKLNPDGIRPRRRRFWNFSWHEIGMLDLPAMIDYVLSSNTDFKKIHYIGHSQGTTAFYVMASMRPEYNEKVLLMNSLAPVAFMGNLRSKYHRILHRFQPLLEASFATLGIYEFLPRNPLPSKIREAFCKEGSIPAVLCQNLMFAMYGLNPNLVDKSKASVIMRHAPAGAATRQLIHYGQLQRRGAGFRNYDYGLIGNLRHHGSRYPKEYPLHQITAPIAIHYGINDQVVAVSDVMRLAAALPNVVEVREVPHPEFGHVDFVWATEIRALLYNHMLTLMKAADQS